MNTNDIEEITTGRGIIPESLIKETTWILEHNRLEAQRLIKNGYCSSLMLEQLFNIANIDFRLNYPREIIDPKNIEEIIDMLTRLYELFDIWKTSQR